MVITPFEIGDYLLIHTAGRPDLDEFARAYWREISDKSQFKHQRQNQTQWCPRGQEKEVWVFGVFTYDPANQFPQWYGTWAWYDVKPFGRPGSGSYSGKLAPMLPGLLAEPTDLTVISTLLDWFLDNDMDSDEGPVRIARLDRPSQEEIRDLRHDWRPGHIPSEQTLIDHPTQGANATKGQ